MARSSQLLPLRGCDACARKARNQASGAEDGGRQPFSLLFVAGPDAPTLSQRLYRLDHASLGALDLFLVPIGPKNGVMQYEAVFN